MGLRFDCPRCAGEKQTEPHQLSIWWGHPDAAHNLWAVRGRTFDSVCVMPSVQSAPSEGCAGCHFHIVEGRIAFLSQ